MQTTQKTISTICMKKIKDELNSAIQKPKAKRGRKPKQTVKKLKTKTSSPVLIKATENKSSFLQTAKEVIQNLIEKLKQRF